MNQSDIGHENISFTIFVTIIKQSKEIQDKKLRNLKEIGEANAGVIVFKGLP